jgi:hypothetical protein
MPKSNKRTKKNSISKSSRKIYRINQKLVKELSKNKSKGVEKSLTKLTNTLNNKKYNKVIKTKKTLRKSKRAGSSLINKSNVEKLSTELVKEVKKVLNGKTNSQNKKKMKKLEKDLLIISQSKKKAGSFGSKADQGIGYYLKKTDELQKGTDKYISSKTGSNGLGKAVGWIAKFTVWGATVAAGVYATDYITDGLVESFDGIEDTGFYDVV